MKKTSYYLLLAVFVGGVLASVWIYQRYFKVEEPGFLLFTVVRGGIEETVKVRGGVVAQKDFDLEFPFSGIVEAVFEEEGRQVRWGDPLMKLETTDFELEITGLQAQLAQAQADLAAQEVILANYYESRDGILNDAYTKANDAVRKQLDELFSDDERNPQLVFPTPDSQTEIDVESQRLLAGKTLDEWRAELDDPNKAWASAKSRLVFLRSFLDRTLDAVIGSAGISQTTANAYKANINTARASINTALVNITDQEQSISSQEAAIKSYEASIRNYEAQIAIVRENVRKSTLYAPSDAKVTKIWLERQELAGPGQVAVSLSTSGQKIQSDVSELEIGKIRDAGGNDALIQFDAFPGLEFRGKVVSIEPREIVKEGDKYYRVNIYFDDAGNNIRSGMNADVTMNVSRKDDVLKIPEFAVSERDGKKFAKLVKDGVLEETEIETGISDGENIEVVRGLGEGQTIAIAAD